MTDRVLCGDMRYFAKWLKSGLLRNSRLHLVSCGSEASLARDFLRTGYVEVNCREYEELKRAPPDLWDQETPARQMRLGL